MASRCYAVNNGGFQGISKDCAASTAQGDTRDDSPTNRSLVPPVSELASHLPPTFKNPEHLFDDVVEWPSKAQEITNGTEPNAQQDQGNHLQFESVEQEERQYHNAQRDHIELREARNS
jgi:hypothetical protein